MPRYSTSAHCGLTLGHQGTQHGTTHMGAPVSRTGFNRGERRELIGAPPAAAHKGENPQPKPNYELRPSISSSSSCETDEPRPDQKDVRRLAGGENRGNGHGAPLQLNKTRALNQIYARTSNTRTPRYSAISQSTQNRPLARTSPSTMAGSGEVVRKLGNLSANRGKQGGIKMGAHQ